MHSSTAIHLFFPNIPFMFCHPPLLVYRLSLPASDSVEDGAGDASTEDGSIAGDDGQSADGVTDGEETSDGEETTEGTGDGTEETPDGVENQPANNFSFFHKLPSLPSAHNGIPKGCYIVEIYCGIDDLTDEWFLGNRKKKLPMKMYPKPKFRQYLDIWTAAPTNVPVKDALVLAICISV